MLTILVSQSFSSLKSWGYSARITKGLLRVDMKKSKDKTLGCVKGATSLLQGKMREKKIIASKTICFNNQIVKADKCHLLSLCKFMSPSMFSKMYWSFII